MSPERRLPQGLHAEDERVGIQEIFSEDDCREHEERLPWGDRGGPQRIHWLIIVSYLAPSARRWMICGVGKVLGSVCLI